MHRAGTRNAPTIVPIALVVLRTQDPVLKNDLMGEECLGCHLGQSMDDGTSLILYLRSGVCNHSEALQVLFHGSKTIDEGSWKVLTLVNI